nr:ctl-like protein [Quercus suber]
MSDSQSRSPISSSSSSSATDQNVSRSQRSGDGGQTLASGSSRHWRDIFWMAVFMLHMVVLGFGLTVLGLNRFQKKDRLNIDKYAAGITEHHEGLTEDYWPIVLCFWGEQFFWGVVFAIGAALQFLYIISVIDRLPFTMLVLQKSVKMVWSLPEVMRVAYAFMFVMLLWMGLWSFGAAGVVASSLGESGCWWLLVVLSVSLFWTGAVLCNTVHVIVSGMVFLVLIHGGREASSIPPNSLIKSLQYAVTTSFGSICYGSLFTAAIRTLRWEIRGVRSKIGNNECLLCCVDFLFHLVETLVRFFNKYAYVQIAVYGKSFNHSARDAWELFQSTGVEALVAYDCSGAVLLMGTLMGGLVTGTCTGVWTWFESRDRVSMVGSTAMLMGMVLVGLAMVVVESAVTSIYICYAEDPLLIHRWDAEFFNQMSERLHQRLQHRSARAREVLTHTRLDGHSA